MNKRMLDILACPDCKGKLTLSIISEVQDDIITGSLSCITCDISYPITNSVPNFMNRSNSGN